MSREDVLEDKDMQNLVEEFAKVEATLEKKEEAASPSSNEAGEAPKDEPPRELPETDETTTEAEVVAEGNDTEPVDELSQQLTDLAEIYGLHPELLAGQFTSVDDARAARRAAPPRKPRRASRSRSSRATRPIVARRVGTVFCRAGASDCEPRSSVHKRRNSCLAELLGHGT